MSREESIHELYLQCKEIQLDETYVLIKNAKTKEERYKKYQAKNNQGV